MPRIKKEGSALVKINSAVWKPCKGGMQAHIIGVNEDGDYATGRITANETIIKSGPHKGKTMVVKALEDLVVLGLPTEAGKACPHRLGEMTGKQVEFVMEERTFKGEDGDDITLMDVKYINSVGGGKPAATREEANSFFGKLGFSDSAREEPAVDSGDIDDPPF